MFKELKLFIGLRKNWMTYCLYDLNCVWKYMWLSLHSQLAVILFLGRLVKTSIDYTVPTTEQRNNIIMVQLEGIVSLLGYLRNMNEGH